MENSLLLQQLIHQWDHGRQGFKVNLDLWYHPTEEDVYFMTGLSRMGEDFPQFPELQHGIAGEIHFAYV
jgi:hypothetical protein